MVGEGEAFPKGLTRQEALNLLRTDIQTRVDPSVRGIGVALSQDQVDAIGSFIFNVGGGNFSRSTLLQQLNAGNFLGVGGEFGRWVYAGGNVLPGLVTRRATEASLFLRGLDPGI